MSGYSQEPPYINREFRVGYLAHPKTASVATSRTLLQIPGFEVNLKTGRSHHAPLEHPMPDGWIVMTTVRNHFPTLVSWYYHQGYDNKQPFNVAFMKELLGDPNATHNHFRGRELWGLHSHHATHILRFERLEQDLRNTLELRGLNFVNLRYENHTKNKPDRPYQEYYDDDTRAYVEDRFGDEMDRLGYSFEESLSVVRAGG